MKPPGCLGLILKQKHLAVYIFFFCKKKQDGNTVEFRDICIYIYTYIFLKFFFSEVG